MYTKNEYIYAYKGNCLNCLSLRDILYKEFYVLEHSESILMIYFESLVLNSPNIEKIASILKCLRGRYWASRVQRVELFNDKKYIAFQSFSIVGQKFISALHIAIV